MSKPFDWGVAIWYYNQDGLGSVSEITDWQGNLLEKYTYDEYGSFTIKDAQGNPLDHSPSGNRFYFTGREYDFLTGLYYYRARYYDPTIGRFLQTDPIGYYGGINLYTYVNNNPANWIDPWGLDPEKEEKSIWDKIKEWMENLSKGLVEGLKTVSGPIPPDTAQPVIPGTIYEVDQKSQALDNIYDGNWEAAQQNIDNAQKMSEVLQNQGY